MTDQELLELCKEVYEKTGWSGTDFVIWRGKVSHKSRIAFSYFDGVRPLYTSDYLLEKLPPVIQHDKKFKVITLWVNGDKTAHADYLEPYDKEFRGSFLISADTPLKALLKLVIALHAAGELS